MKTLTIELLQNCKSVSEAIELTKTYYADYPKPAVRPRLYVHTSVEANKYAQELEVYEKEHKEYVQKYEEYNQQNFVANKILEEYLKIEAGFDNVPKQYRAKLWALAWDCGHSSGYYNVYQNAVQLAEIFIL